MPWDDNEYIEIIGLEIISFILNRSGSCRAEQEKERKDGGKELHVLWEAPSHEVRLRPKL